MSILFSNLRKLILDRETGQYIASNNLLETSEGFFFFTQETPSSSWMLKHFFKNKNYIIAVYITKPDGSYSKAYPTIIQSDDSTINLSFGATATTGYVCILFVEDDSGGLVPTLTATPTPTPTPTPSPTA